MIGDDKRNCICACSLRHADGTRIEFGRHDSWAEIRHGPLASTTKADISQPSRRRRREDSTIDELGVSATGAAKAAG